MTKRVGGNTPEDTITLATESSTAASTTVRRNTPEDTITLSTESSTAASTTAEKTTTEKITSPQTTGLPTVASTKVETTTIERATQAIVTVSTTVASTTAGKTTTEKITSPQTTEAPTVASTTVETTTIERATQAIVTVSTTVASTTAETTTLKYITTLATEPSTATSTTAEVTTTKVATPHTTQPSTVASTTAEVTTTTAHSSESSTAVASTTGATVTIPVQTTTIPLATTVKDLGPAVALYEFGVNAGDLSIKEKTTEVTSALLKPKIGFPFGATMYKSLYFTDNGQIIFPAFVSEIRKYTNPPAEGFKASSKPAMLAAFWDDADLSSGGNIYYQEYSTISSSNSIVKDIESKIQTNLKVTYTAKWTLKITWENIPAYPAEMFKDKTNTFQAIITTDGVEAYSMMLYKDKGMNWDTDRLATTNVLMGYNSADGFFLNDGQMSKTPKDKYRPDRFIGANSNIRGLWIYKLTKGTFKENFKVKCLEWAELEPEVSTWASDMADCPCSLQQGRQDGRYRTAGTDGDFTVLRSVSSASRQGARCLYNKKGSFYNGWIERYPKKIIESRQAEDGICTTTFWCCKNIEDPKFCDYYQTKRPRRDCSSYRAPSSGLMNGDPHIASFDDLHYTFNGLGDFILINAQDSDSSFTLQARTVITPNSKATNFNNFAAQYKENGTTNTVLWTLKGTDSVDVTVNNTLISEFTILDSGEFYEADEILLERSRGNTISATFSAILSIKVTASFSMLNAVINLPSKYKDKTEGLLGKWNDDQSDDLKKRNGDIIPPSSTESEIYTFGLTWDAGQESLFPSKNKSVQNKTADTSFKPVFLEDLKILEGYAKAKETCGNDLSCIFDGMSTGNLTIGLATKETFTSFVETKTALESFPPNITGIKLFTASIGETVTATYTAKTSDGSQVKFTPITLDDVNLTESGILTWIPTSVKPLIVTVEAVGENNMTAILQPMFVVCNCGTNGECVFADTTRVGDSALYETSCKCNASYIGKNCQIKQSICETVSCYPGVVCNETTGCAQCPAGKEGNGIQCSDINHCLSNPCPSTASCTSVKDSFRCNCNEGYKGDGTTSCIDVNECKISSPCSLNANCTNEIGSYKCVCKQGFNGDGKNCTDIDECKNSSCTQNATCTNTEGSYTCTCKPGYTGDGKTSCTDVDECKTSSPCSPNANCTNEIGSYKCVCKQGFNGDGKNCTEIDECKNSSCIQNAICTNTEGSYTCTCKPGYTEKSNRYTVTLNQNATCTNTEGSYTCTCKPGYTGDGKNCTDINECTLSLCNQNATCTNTEGSYTCTCKPGYTGDGKNCTDINECTLSLCNQNATCTNTEGSYTCTCKPGYTGDGKTSCTDVDECKTSSPCSPNANCTNEIGSYKCVCKQGFNGDGKNCTEIDECKNSSCIQNATCTNTEGSYTCTCKPGYTGDGKNCTDINECTLSLCNQNATCTNTEGSYTCTCKPGYTGDGKNCTDINECTLSLCNQNATCTNTEGSYTCTCKPGYTGDGKTSCTDVDECKTSSPCSPNANCTNEIGSYKCVCKQGFQGDGQFCIDINECLNSLSCSPYADCANSVGSYKCTCKQGYAGDGKLCNNSCGDCPADFCSNGGSCTQIPAGGCKATCTCPSPYTGQRCDLAGLTFEPKPLASAPKRSLKLILKLKGDYNQQVISDIKSPEYVSLVNQIDTKVAQRMLTLTVKTFSKNQDIVLKIVNNRVAAEFLSLFDYGASITDIDFLNNKLQDAIVDVLNLKVQRRRREDTVQFEPVTKADITDVNKATAEDLLQYMSCASKGIKGYSAVFDPKTGILCVSPCLTNDYCKNGGTCQHYIEGPMCKCVSFQMYAPYGENCEYLAMNLRAFFGILFGTLAFIFVVVVLLFLLFYCYCRQIRSPNLSESLIQI
ncbi:mucin-4-like [Polyodon spathula]|uniref:mucin-4-like n=1 Tax=Polyodon spathula TaxID=7913 RepID=UPI001B7F6716|nr:mucin-4-like [Polyodon spathula]